MPLNFCIFLIKKPCLILLVFYWNDSFKEMNNCKVDGKCWIFNEVLLSQGVQNAAPGLFAALGLVLCDSQLQFKYDKFDNLIFLHWKNIQLFITKIL